MNYFKIDVIGVNGYSFMITSSDNNITDEQIIDDAAEQGLFDDVSDRFAAQVDRLVDEMDIEFFKDCTYSID